MEQTERTFTLTVIVSCSDIDLTKLTAANFVFFCTDLIRNYMPVEPVDNNEAEFMSGAESGIEFSGTFKWSVDPIGGETPESDT